MLYRAGEINLHTAVDRLQWDAKDNGLVNELGQDAVQAIMAAAFAPVQAASPPQPKPPPARRVTLEALMYSLNARGMAALAESDTQRRLAQMNDAQLTEIVRRLLVPRFSKPWSQRDVERLIEFHGALI